MPDPIDQLTAEVLPPQLHGSDTESQVANAPTPQPAQQPSISPQQNVSNTLANIPAATESAIQNPNPSVRRAGWVRQIAETLAGGPRYQVTIDPDTGATRRDPIPVSGRHLGLAIALEALSGGLTGLGQTGPNAAGRAAAAGVTQGMALQQRQQQLQEQRAQQEYQNQGAALARRAALLETNSRTILNTSEAERQGLDTIQALVNLNRQSGILDLDPVYLDNSGQPLTQDHLMQAIKAGKLSSTDHLGPIAGAIQLTNADGSTRIEATHLVVRDPNATIHLTQDQWNRYAEAGVPGYPKGVNIGSGIDVPVRMIANANEVAGSHYLANQRLSDLRDVLQGTQYEKQVPAAIDFSKPGVVKAIQRWQTYVSHNSDNLDDPYLALQTMSAARRDPKTGAMSPNPDATSADIIAQQLGGWNVLRAAHDEIEAQKKTASEYAVIDTADKANAVLAAPKRFSPAQVSAARNFITLSNEAGESTTGYRGSRSYTCCTGANEGGRKCRDSREATG